MKYSLLINECTFSVMNHHHFSLLKLFGYYCARITASDVFVENNFNEREIGIKAIFFQYFFIEHMSIKLHYHNAFLGYIIYRKVTNESF